MELTKQECRLKLSGEHTGMGSLNCTTWFHDSNFLFGILKNPSEFLQRGPLWECNQDHCPEEHFPGGRYHQPFTTVARESSRGRRPSHPEGPIGSWTSHSCLVRNGSNSWKTSGQEGRCKGSSCGWVGSPTKGCWWGHLGPVQRPKISRDLEVGQPLFGAQ